MSLDFSYDEKLDIFMVEGVAYSGQMFRELGHAEPGTWYRISQRRDQLLMVYRAPDHVSRAFDAITGRGRARR